MFPLPTPVVSIAFGLSKKQGMQVKVTVNSCCVLLATALLIGAVAIAYSKVLFSPLWTESYLGSTRSTKSGRYTIKLCLKFQH